MLSHPADAAMLGCTCHSRCQPECRDARGAVQFVLPLLACRLQEEGEMEKLPDCNINR